MPRSATFSLAGLAVGVASIFCATPIASAATPRVTGRIAGADHYTLLELAPNGRTGVVKLGRRGAFSLPDHRGWTLQLLSPDSHYFGPIVLSQKSTKGWEGLSGRAVALGKVTLRHGYAAPKTPAPPAAVLASAWLHVTASGPPIGAGNLGLVLAKRKASRMRTALEAQSPPNGSPSTGPGTGTGSQNGGPSSALQPGADPDQDGIPTTFDADAIGSGEPNQENTQASDDGTGGGIFTQVGGPIAGSVNLDAGVFSSADVAGYLAQALGLNFGLQDRALGSIQSVSVDCGALTYCSTATVQADAGNVLAHGSTWTGEVPAGNSPGMFQIALQLHTTPSAIQPGDTYEIDYHTAAGVVPVPSELTLYFATGPAVASIGEGTGAAAAADPQPIAYPAGPDVYGSADNPVMLNGDSLNLSFWRPQRAAFPGEAGPYLDMGHLHYGVGLAVPNGTDNCAASDFSDLSSTLGDAPSTGESMYDASYPLIDNASDAAPSSANQLGFTVNLDACLAADGQPTTGQEITVGLAAADDPRNGASDSGSQSIDVCLPGCTPGDVSGPGGTPPPGAGNPPATNNVFASGLPTQPNPTHGDPALTLDVPRLVGDGRQPKQ